jgi:putative mRNA 3-end processing factor
LRVGWFNGVIITTEAGLLHFDPQNQSSGNVSTFISHAHGDHLGGFNRRGQGYLTPETLDIARAIRSLDANSLVPLRIGDAVRRDGLEVVAHNAGHMLGSAQFEVRSPDLTLVYTGDINCRDMFTTDAAERISCDILVLETTYGIPFYNFPDLTQTSTEIVEWALGQIRAGRIPVFKTYSGGKAQEVLKIFNTLTKVPVVAEGATASITEAYVKNGVNLKCVNSTTVEAQELLKSGECVCLTSTSYGLMSLRNSSIAVATGWALGRRLGGVDAAFPLSGHADFRQLAEYVEDARPKEVLTVHGFKEEFASYVRKKLGIKARPIPSMSQRLLGEYV